MKSPHRAIRAYILKRTCRLALRNYGTGGALTDGDLYVFCAIASDGVLTAHPYLKGEHLQDIVGKNGFPLARRSCGPPPIYEGWRSNLRRRLLQGTM